MFKISYNEALSPNDFPQAIYKFRAWGDEKNDRILTHKEIYLSSPSEFLADYPECKLPERFDLVTDEMLIEKIKQQTRIEFPWLKEPDFNNLCLKRFSRNKFHDLQSRKYGVDFGNSIQDDYLGIFSACRSKFNLQMWERFADLSTGYCVGLNPYNIYFEENCMGAVGAVDYYEESNPPIILPISITPEESIINQMKKNFSVPIKYNYEDEYRIAKYSYIHYKGNYTKIKYNINTRRKVLRDNCFVEILLGSDISARDRHDIIQISIKNFPNCPIFQAEFNSATKEITFNQINHN